MWLNMLNPLSKCPQGQKVVPHPGVSLSRVSPENSSHTSHWLIGWVSKEMATLRQVDKPWQDEGHTYPKRRYTNSMNTEWHWKAIQRSVHAFYSDKYSYIQNKHYLDYAQGTLWKYLVVKYDIFLQSNSTELTGNEHITSYWAWRRAVGKRGDWMGEVGWTRGARRDDVVVRKRLFGVQRRRLLAKRGDGRGRAATGLVNNNEQETESHWMCFRKCTTNTYWII